MTRKNEEMIPTHLSGTEPMGIIEGQTVAQYGIGDYLNFVYLIIDWDSRKAAWVDPQADLSLPLQDMKAQGLQLNSILLTHTHHDHVAGVPELAKRFPEVPICLHQGDLHRIQSRLPSTAKLKTVQDSEILSLGSTRIEVLHTPGHSAGEICFQVSTSKQSYLLTGDTLFIRNCGRTDLETGSDAEMFATLQRLRNLSPGLVILPGHHYTPECASTLGRELKESPPFQCKSIGELAALP